MFMCVHCVFPFHSLGVSVDPLMLTLEPGESETTQISSLVQMSQYHSKTGRRYT